MKLTAMKRPYPRKLIGDRTHRGPQLPRDRSVKLYKLTPRQYLAELGCAH
jgi:hypothetical protein